MAGASPKNSEGLFEKRGGFVKLKTKVGWFFFICILDICLFGAVVKLVSEAYPREISTLSQVYKVKEDRKEGEGKCVALTFDDGPHRECTPKLLDGLKERGVHATFFLMGQNIEGNENIIKRMKEEGHLIGNHGYSHVQMTKADPAKAKEAVEKTSQMIEKITGEKPEYLRPPYGDWNGKLEEELDMELTPVFWSVDSLDWKLRNKDRIVRRVLKETQDGSMILMHDIFPTSVSAALELVDQLTKEGYSFVTADELMID